MDAPLVLEQLVWKTVSTVAPLVAGDSRTGFFESKWLCLYDFQYFEIKPSLRGKAFVPACKQ